MRRKIYVWADDPRQAVEKIRMEPDEVVLDVLSCRANHHSHGVWVWILRKAIGFGDKLWEVKIAPKEVSR